MVTHQLTIFSVTEANEIGRPKVSLVLLTHSSSDGIQSATFAQMNKLSLNKMINQISWNKWFSIIIPTSQTENVPFVFSNHHPFAVKMFVSFSDVTKCENTCIYIHIIYENTHFTQFSTWHFDFILNFSLLPEAWEFEVSAQCFASL